MGFFDVFKSKWKHSKPEVRKVAIEYITDQVLSDIVDHKNYSVLRLADLRRKKLDTEKMIYATFAILIEIFIEPYISAYNKNREEYKNKGLQDLLAMNIIAIYMAASLHTLAKGKSNLKKQIFEAIINEINLSIKETSFETRIRRHLLFLEPYLRNVERLGEGLGAVNRAITIIQLDDHDLPSSKKAELEDKISNYFTFVMETSWNIFNSSNELLPTKTLESVTDQSFSAIIAELLVPFKRRALEREFDDHRKEMDNLYNMLNILNKK